MAAFASSGLKSVVIPGSVENIDAYTFEGCKKLKKVIIKDGVKTIGLFAFGDCTSLTDIIIPASVTDIEFQFTHCKETPFNGCCNITVHCQKGSYVENYIYFYCYGLGYKVKTDLTGTNQIIIASDFTKNYGDAAFSIDAALALCAKRKCFAAVGFGNVFGSDQAGIIIRISGRIFLLYRNRDHFLCRRIILCLRCGDRNMRSSHPRQRYLAFCIHLCNRFIKESCCRR